MDSEYTHKYDYECRTCAHETDTVDQMCKHVKECANELINADNCGRGGFNTPYGIVSKTYLMRIQNNDYTSPTLPTSPQIEPIATTVNRPPHYARYGSTYEPINVIQAWKLNFTLGNVVKYISRAGFKGSRLEDLKKASWYLTREIETLELIAKEDLSDTE